MGKPWCEKNIAQAAGSVKFSSKPVAGATPGASGSGAGAVARVAAAVLS